MAESKANNRLIFPNTYSTRVKGRQKYKGSALLARSGATNPGPTKAVSSTAMAPWNPQKNWKKAALIFSICPAGMSMEPRMERLCVR